ncbi:hypothetical protein PsorP6_013149 [Peronosclerospora sorghi]|uniref:Uncharacterized protein n=1 Tax=Peronosclerospora sorghi TaxID=230839 RepID=A0ACC0WH41_9STRA|nr:hypothetical protein PsorP6_013149 [Peronosclerospora sorghi]
MPPPLCVTYRTPLDRALRACITKQLVKFLLYLRGQVPCLYDDLRQFVETLQQQQQQHKVHEPRRRSLPPVRGGIKKAMRCVEAAEQLFHDQLDMVFAMHVKRGASIEKRWNVRREKRGAHAYVRPVALVFGASMLRPREAVILDFDDGVDAEEEEDQVAVGMRSSPPKRRDTLPTLCAQKLLRAFFTHSMEHFARQARERVVVDTTSLTVRALPATKLHLAVFAERQSTRVPGFLPNQHFKLRLPKENNSHRRTHYVTICSRVHDDTTQLVQEEDTANPLPTTPVRRGNTDLERSQSAGSTHACMLWYVQEKPIPGFTEALNTVGGP